MSFFQRTRRAAKEAHPPPATKATRRRRANSSDLDNMGTLGQTDDYEDSQFEKIASNANSSEDDFERPASKRGRHSQ